MNTDATSRKPLSRRFLMVLALLGASVLALALGGRLHAGPGGQQSPWQEEFATFDAADRKHPVPPGGVVFVGSSSIRLWDDLESQFPDQPVVVKRGFGGSRLLDCAAYLDRLVLAYRPRLVVLYAGDNDLASGRTPQQVLDSYVEFVEGVHRALPETRIAFVSIKPSPARAALLAQMQQANALIRERAAADPRLDFIDIHAPMLGPDGQPRPELFRTDRLHMNARGYALWRELIAPHLH